MFACLQRLRKHGLTPCNFMHKDVRRFSSIYLAANNETIIILCVISRWRYCVTILLSLNVLNSRRRVQEQFLISKITYFYSYYLLVFIF